MALSLSQRAAGNDYGGTDYFVVVSSSNEGGGTAELQHEYCSTHPQAGPIRPDKVTDLRVEPSADPQLSGGVVKWEWSENAFDQASPGAWFERTLASLTDGAPLAWAGDVVRTPKPKARRPSPPVAEPGALPLLLADVRADSIYTNEYGEDRVAVHVRHAPSGSSLTWEGTSDAKNQSLSQFSTSIVDGAVAIEFVYRTGENGSWHSSNMCLYVRLGAGAKLEWAKKT